MLSIIISSYQPHYFTVLEKNIAETCGVEYEVIKIENPALMGICEAYNKGAEKARYDNLLFIHEDILISTMNWGKPLVLSLSEAKTGIIGIAGGTYVPAAPYGWFTTMNNAKISIIQHKKDGSKIVEKTFETKKEKVIAVDGVFLSIKKSVFNKFKFDENLKGYHGYDTELSLRISSKYQNYVTSEILIEHFSQGNPDHKWLESNIYTRNKLGSNFNIQINKDLEYQMYERFVRDYFKYHSKNLLTLIKILKFFPIFKIGRRKYLPLLKFTITQ